MDVSGRIRGISAEIADACGRSGRDAQSVSLMLVTKTVPASRISQAVQCGHRLFGENKIQEVQEKWAAPELQSLKPDFIGHLQTNKVKPCLDACARIHSVDRMRLVEALDRELQARGEKREVLLQVNTSGEASKFGVPLEEAMGFARSVKRYPTLDVRGLMTLAVFSREEEKVRPCFKKLQRLFAEIRDEDLFGGGFRHLSMGMSGDYRLAVEEGSTIVRIGTAVFGARATPDSFYWPEAAPKRQG